MSNFEQIGPKGEKFFKKPEYVKPPPSEKQKLEQSTKKLESITEIVDLERESLIRTIERLKNKASIIELILNHGSLTGKMILKNGIIIDVSLDEYNEIEAIIYLIQITEEDLLSYLPMFLRKKLEEENLLYTLESMIKFRPQDIKFELELEKQEINKESEKKIDKQKNDTLSIEELDKEIEALLKEIDTKTQKEDKSQSYKEKEEQNLINEIEQILIDVEEESTKQNEIPETKSAEINQEIDIPDSQTQVEVIDSQTQIDVTDSQIQVDVIDSQTQVDVTDSQTQVDVIDSQTQIDVTDSQTQVDTSISENTESPKYEEIDIIELEKSQEIDTTVQEVEKTLENDSENFQVIQNQKTTEEKIKEDIKETRIDKKENLKREESKIMVIENLVSKLSHIPPLEEFHIINIDSEELEYSSNESLDDFSSSTIIAVYKDLSVFSNLFSEKLTNLIIETDNFYYILNIMDSSRILLSKCSKKSNPSLISSLINKAIKK